MEAIENKNIKIPIIEENGYRGYSISKVVEVPGWTEKQLELRTRSVQKNLETKYIQQLEQEHKKLLPKLTDKQWLEIFPEAEPYLSVHLTELQTKQKKLGNEIKNNLLKIYSTCKDKFSVWFGEEIIKMFKGNKLNQLTKEIRKIKWALSTEENGNKTNKITDDMIQRAREYPFDQLVEFNRAKKALCIFHNEKTPSMSLNPKKNRIKCFGCGVSFDTIGFIMETQKIPFIDAVKYLNNY